MGILKNKIEDLEEDLLSIKQKKLQLNVRLDELNNTETKINEQIKRYTLITYNDQECRNSLISCAEKNSFSPNKIEKLKDWFSRWNIDCITDEVVDLIIETETHNEFFSQYNKSNGCISKNSGIINKVGKYFSKDRRGDDVN